MKALLTIALALTLVAPAGGTTLKGNILKRHQSWITEAQKNVPLPRGTLRISLRGCPYAWACAGDTTIYLPTDFRSEQEERTVLLHELGHVFDQRHMSMLERRQFRRALGMIRCDWSAECGGTPPHEAFAELYAACALGLTRDQMENRFYDFNSSPEIDRRVCVALRGWR